MRTPKDRSRQAIAFEVIGLMLTIPLGAFVFEFPLQQFGVLGVIGATLATAWNYLYNLLFDHALKRWRGSTRKTLTLRVIHAILFELGLMVVFLPIIAWWLNVTLVAALIIDLAFVAFYLVYTFIFTWCYDIIFPDPEQAARDRRAAAGDRTAEPRQSDRCGE